MTTTKPLPPGIHIILGESAGGIFTRVFRARDRLLVDQDVLSSGPTPPRNDLKAWAELRLEFWNNLIPGERSGFYFSRHSLLPNAQRLCDAECIHIWAATSLSEQLFIASVIQLVDLLGADPGRVALVQFTTTRSRGARVLGMGELNEENMSAFPEPQPLSPSQLGDYRAAWAALTSEDPRGYEHLPNACPDANPWLKQATPLMMRRFPDIRSGLTHWDFLLLKKAREFAPRCARIIAAAVTADLDDPDHIGDLDLFGRLLRLGDEGLPKPLVQLSGNKNTMSGTEVTVTPFGIDVLEGDASSYPSNPIDFWAGGVRLSSTEGRLWFDCGGTLRPQSAASAS